MQLYYTTRSPFARKVNIIAHEAKKSSALQLIPVDLWDPENTLRKINPLGKVPTLILDDGTVMIESPIICAYLNEVWKANLFPKFNTPDYWKAMWWQGLGDGILLTIVNRYFELEMRPIELQSLVWTRRYEMTIRESFHIIKERITELEELDFGIAQITMVATIDYLHFRIPQLELVNKHPEVFQWYQKVTQRESFRNTLPVN